MLGIRRSVLVNLCIIMYCHITNISNTHNNYNCPVWSTKEYFPQFPDSVWRWLCGCMGEAVT